jgi:hypothetical protein
MIRYTFSNFNFGNEVRMVSKVWSGEGSKAGDGGGREGKGGQANPSGDVSQVSVGLSDEGVALQIFVLR